jgi:hypothetical protein
MTAADQPVTLKSIEVIKGETPGLRSGVGIPLQDQRNPFFERFTGLMNPVRGIQVAWVGSGDCENRWMAGGTIANYDRNWAKERCLQSYSINRIRPITDD